MKNFPSLFQVIPCCGLFQKMENKQVHFHLEKLSESQRNLGHEVLSFETWVLDEQFEAI